jgi:hypothetical protein
LGGATLVYIDLIAHRNAMFRFHHQERKKRLDKELVVIDLSEIVSSRKLGAGMRHILVCLFLGVLAVGCEKKEQGPAAPAASAAPQVEAPVVPAAVAEAPKVEARAVPAAVTEAPQPSAKVDVPTAPPAIADAARPAESAAPTTAPGATADAQSKLQMAMQYIKDKKFDLAEKLLGELDAQKSSLPASLQGQIATAQTALKAGKATSGASGAAGGITVPSLGK